MKKPVSINKIALTAGTVFTVSNTVFKSVDPRIRSVATISSGFLLAILSKGNSIPLSIGFGFMVAGGADTTNSMRGGGISSNKYNGIIYYKKENDSNVSILKPFETIGVFKKIDGLCTSFMPGFVFKIPDGCYVDILESGEVKLAKGFSSFINNRAKEKAGWKNKKWVDKFPTWIELYNKSL